MKKFTLLVAALAISLVTFAQGKITYELNGGVTNDYGWKDINDVYVDMNADWNAYSGTTKTWKPLADIDPANSTTGFATSVGGGDEAKFNEFMADEVYGPKYGWIYTYVKKVFVDQGNDLAKFSFTNARWNISNFFVCGNTAATGWQLGCDYTVAGQLASYQPTWKHGYCGPDSIFEGETVVLPIPYMEGESFLGWYKEADFSGEKVTILTEAKDITLYAKFGEYIPTIAEVIALEDSTATKVQGTVTYVAGNNFWIQDASAGILCYGANDFKEGDLVTLAGKKVIYNDSPELLLDSVDAIISKEEGKAVKSQTLLLSTILADTAKYLNELVYLEGVLISGYKGDYKDPYITDGFNEIVLYKWNNVKEDKYPVDTKISLKAVLSIYKGKLQLRGQEAWITPAALAAKDPFEYPEVKVGGYKHTLTSNWMYSVNLENWNDNRPNPVGEGTRSVVEKDGILYFAYRNNNTPTEQPKLVRVEAKTGKMLEPVVFADSIFKDVNGNWLFGPYSDFKLDNAGNAITSNLPTTGGPFQIWNVDLKTGAGKLIIDLTDSINLLSTQFPDSVYKKIRLDRIGVYGDINGDATIMSAVSKSDAANAVTIGKHALYWDIKDGKWDGKSHILKLAFGEEADNLGTAPVICPIEDNYFYVDGFDTYPMLFDPDGGLADAFDVNHEADALTIGAKNVAREKGHNGVTEFEVNGEYYLIIAGDNTEGKGTAPSTFVMYKFADEDRAFKDMTQLWEFPMAGMGSMSNPQRVATSFARPNENGTAVDIYVFTAENGYGSYTMTIEEAIDDAVENVTLNFNIWVENSTIVADADIEAIFTVTGQNVTILNGNLEAGAYIVRTAEGVAKVMVK